MTSNQLYRHSNGYHETVSSGNFNSDLSGNRTMQPVKDLPPGMNELVSDCFAPGIRGFFEKRTNLPFLKSTNLAILKRQNSRNRIRTPLEDDSSVLNGIEGRKRSSSIGAGFYNNGDLGIVKACWEIVVSFMVDENEALEKGQCTELFESTVLQRRKNLTTKVKLWRKSSNADVAMRKKSGKRPSSMFVTSDFNGNHEPKIVPAPPSENDKCVLSRETVASMTVLEKVRFLSNVGLENPCFRDEIYCQIMKQLVHNPSARSTALGWILLSLITGCFSPSEKILNDVQTFLQHQPTACSVYCREKLKRTLQNGERKNPPCSLELQAAKSRQQIRFPVICMDHSVRTIWTDSASTAKEMCEKMASKNRLGDSFGFALYLSLDKKLVSLGNGNFHVMDAISQAERFSKINNVHEIWRIYYRREFFSLADAACLDDNHMKTWLTFSQICGGVQSGEYQCCKAQDLALLLAHQYFVRHGLDKIDTKRVAAVCEQCLPAAVGSDGKKKKWCQMVLTTLKALSAKSRSGGKLDSLDVMQQVVRYGSMAFIDKFTKIYFLSTFQPTSDNGNCVIDIMMKVNHVRIVVCRNSTTKRLCETTDNNILMEILIQNLKSVELKDDCELTTSDLTLTTRNGKSYAIGSSQAKEISFILQHFIKESSVNSNETDA